MILPAAFALLSLLAVTASAQKKCSLNCPKSKALQPPGKKCIPCPPPNAAKVRADGDPHVSVSLARSQLDRPICYDVIGTPWDTLRIYEVGDLKVDAQLVPSPRRGHHDSMYFGRFIFSIDDRKVGIEVTTAAVIILNGTVTSEVVPWHSWVSKGRPVFYADDRLEIVHWKRKVIRVNFDGTRFEIKRNLLKYGVKKGVIRNFDFLGIYLENEDPSITYGGIIGESLSAVAVHSTDGDQNQLTIGDTTKATVNVTDAQRYDYLNDRTYSCWMISDLRVLLKNKYDSYKV